MASAISLSLPVYISACKPFPEHSNTTSIQTIKSHKPYHHQVPLPPDISPSLPTFVQNKMSSVVNTAGDQYLMPFLLEVTVTPTQRLKLLIIGPMTPIDRNRDSNRDLEAARQEVADGRTNNKYDNNLDWATIIVVFCFTAAIEIAFLPFQGPTGHLHLPVIFYFLGLSILLAFTCILVNKFIHFSYCFARITIAPIFHQLGLFFGVTAFFISISIPFPLWFKCATMSIYIVTFLLVVLCNLHFNKYYKTHGFKYPNPAIDPAVESCGGSTSTIEDQACIICIE